MVKPAPSPPDHAAPAVPHVIALPMFDMPGGSIGVVEGTELPFVMHRMYWLQGLRQGTVRGDHAHRLLQQLIIALQGEIMVTLDDGWRTLHLGLDRSDQGLVIPGGWWRSLRVESATALICVLASHPHDPEDYIRSYDAFLAWAQAGRPPPASPQRGNDDAPS